jgi:hypothetical protein
MLKIPLGSQNHSPSTCCQIIKNDTGATFLEVLCFMQHKIDWLPKRAALSWLHQKLRDRSPMVWKTVLPMSETDSFANKQIVEITLVRHSHFYFYTLRIK